MIDSERLAIAAHLHVLLRRKAGRVTDMEWMARNVEYAAEIIRFARSRALEDNVPELAELAARLEQAMFPASRSMGGGPAASSPSAAAAQPGQTVPSSIPGFTERDASRYVGGLR